MLPAPPGGSPKRHQSSAPAHGKISTAIGIQISSDLVCGDAPKVAGSARTVRYSTAVVDNYPSSLARNSRVLLSGHERKMAFGLG